MSVRVPAFEAVGVELELGFPGLARSELELGERGELEARAREFGLHGSQVELDDFAARARAGVRDRDARANPFAGANFPCDF